MHLLIYAGPGPWRDEALATAAQFAGQVATSVTLVTGGGIRNATLLDDAVARLGLPRDVAVQRRVVEGTPQDAILTIAGEAVYDLVIFGRFQRPLERLLPLRRSDALTRRLRTAVLRVSGPARPIRRILLASGGDQHTFATAGYAAQLATPLGASITLLHVVSQQPVVFEALASPASDEATFLDSGTPEAVTLRQVAADLRERAIAVTTRIRFGLVLDEILAELHEGDYDILAVGTHHAAGPLDRMLLEDLTGDLLDRCPRTVLVARRIARD
ncbi:universal stress protein [Roseiflexus sp.]|uniref:universal stress protein n=1 Tax=Roseiflexus sp. TaxID=2562120 RepID=UPI00398A7D31